MATRSPPPSAAPPAWSRRARWPPSASSRRRRKPATATSAAAAAVDGADGCYQVERFVEKPDRATAEQFLRDGGYDWNSGMFLFRAERYLAELGRLRPEIAAATEQAVRLGYRDLDFLRLHEESFNACPSDSIDYAVMEHTERAVVVPADIGWSDVGSWSALWEVQGRDGDGNSQRGDVYLDGVSDSLVRAESRIVAVIGVQRPRHRRNARRRAGGAQGPGAARQAGGRPPESEAAHRAPAPHPGVPAVGPLRGHRRRRPLPGQAHHRQAGRKTVAADAPSPRRALGGGVAAPRA